VGAVDRTNEVAMDSVLMGLVRSAQAEIAAGEAPPDVRARLMATETAIAWDSLDDDGVGIFASAALPGILGSLSMAVGNARSTCIGASVYTDGSVRFSQFPRPETPATPWRDPCIGIEAFQYAMYRQLDQLGQAEGIFDAPILTGPNGHAYQVFKLAREFEFADTLARTLTYQGTRQGHLVTIESAAEDAFVRSLGAYAPNALIFWLGAHGDPSGVWRWRDGPSAGQQFWSGGPAVNTVSPYTWWGSGQPTAGHDCAMSVLWNSTWATQSCGWQAQFVVEYPL
jgi:hypothetical protein